MKEIIERLETLKSSRKWHSAEEVDEYIAETIMLIKMQDIKMECHIVEKLDDFGGKRIGDICSSCYKSEKWGYQPYWKYCPNCGAKIIKKSGRNGKAQSNKSN